MIKHKFSINFISYFLAAILSIYILSGNAYAAEEILLFDSNIVVHEDSSMTVIEKITVRAENKKIKRGIYRDFPTKYTAKAGNKIRVGFEIIDVLRNGNAEPFHTKKVGNGIRIYIGSKSSHIHRGEHTYTIKYKTNQQLGYFESHDELYWNVTGNGWEFPIIKAKASVYLPNSINESEVKTEAFTGGFGSRGQYYDTDTGFSGGHVFTTNRSLSNQEGLTIVVAWPKGHIDQPSFTQKAQWWWQANIDNPLHLIGLVGLLIFYFYSWLQVGRDPKSGVIIPHYEPPQGFPPGGLRYINEMGHDKKAFTAALLNLAVKGYLKIEEVGKTFTLHKLKESSARLPIGERTIHEKLFQNTRSNSGYIELKKSNHAEISSAILGHKKVLNNEYQQGYFIHNRKILYIGIVITFILGAYILLSLDNGADKGSAFFLVFWLSIWTPVTVFLVYSWIAALKSKFTLGKVIGLPIATVFALAWLAGEIGALVALSAIIGIGNCLIIISLFIVNTVFYFLLKKPTLEGRKLLDKTEGFKKYLEVAEQEDLNLKYSPEKTPKLFETYLPYALALGVENQWAEQFTEIFTTHGENKGYQPGSSSGSSSFGGGGGSSGGGGGGGGGGGW
jgi:uncharacterized membrane protein